MIILGISGLYHDSAAALLRDGQLVAAAQEERFTRIRHDDSVPVNAVRFCLEQAGASMADVDAVVFYDKPFLKFERLLFTYLEAFPRGFRSFVSAMPVWMGQKLWTKSLLRQHLDYQGDILFTEHHLAHAASAFLVSPFDTAAILTADGVGEWSTSTLGIGHGRTIDLFSETRFPHSLGLLYSAFTWYLGFKVNSGEYKVMGLAPYGSPVFYDRIRQVIDWKPDGSFRLDMSFFSFAGGRRMINESFHRLMGGPPRTPETRLTQRDFDIAASVQKVVDEIMVAAARHLRQVTGQENLCMAGGVALNCVSNARIVQDSGFNRLWVQPAAGDAGGAIGAAFYHWNNVLQHPRTFALEHAYWGPSYTSDQCREALETDRAVFEAPDDDSLLQCVAEMLAQGQIGGWFSGRMEFGPRALGARSILASPLIPDMKDRLNQAIKFREGFRPFAPSVPVEDAGDWFTFGNSQELPETTRFMLLIGDVVPDRQPLPGITHADGSARVQTVSSLTNPRFHRLLKRFGQQTGVPVLINTSFNVRGEPIVCSPSDAYRCFMRTNMDFLVLENFLLLKKNQPRYNDPGWREKLPLD